MPRPIRSHGENFLEYGEEINCFYHHDHADRPAQMRQDHMIEKAQAPRTIKPGRFDLFAIERFDRREQHQKRKRQPFPMTGS